MSDRETLDVYDKKAGEYAKLVTGTRPDRDLQRFLEALPAQSRVLDWGCGPGNSAVKLREAGHAVVATDASTEMVKLAQGSYGLEARQESFEDLDAVAEFDGIWANFSLLHAERSTFPTHLRAAKTALKPGGILHIGMKLGTGAHRDDIGRFYCYYTEDALTAHLTAAGFDVVQTREGTTKGLAGTTDPFIIMLCRARD